MNAAVASAVIDALVATILQAQVSDPILHACLSASETSLLCFR
jgi:hypothetical protein